MPGLSDTGHLCPSNTSCDKESEFFSVCVTCTRLVRPETSKKVKAVQSVCVEDGLSKMLKYVAQK